MFRLFHICLVLSQDKKRGMIMMMLIWTMTLSSFRKEVIWTMTALMPFLLYLLRNHEPLGLKYQTYHGRFYGGCNVIMMMMMTHIPDYDEHDDDSAVVPLSTFWAWFSASRAETLSTPVQNSQRSRASVGHQLTWGRGDNSWCDDPLALWNLVVPWGEDPWAGEIPRTQLLIFWRVSIAVDVNHC